MKKRLMAVVLAVLVAATMSFALTGCGKNKEKTITVLLLTNEQERVFYTKYFEDMEAELKEDGLDYEIEFTGYQKKDYYDTLGSLIQQNSVPDIFYVRPNELMQYKELIASLQSFANTQTYANLDDIYEYALDMYRFNPNTGALGNKSDDLYAFPKDLSTQQLGYNKTLLQFYQTDIKAAGIQKLPWEMDYTQETYTWDEYKTMCKAIADAAKTKKPESVGSAEVYASDVPSVEILAKSFSSDKSKTTSPLIDMTGGRANAKVGSLTDGAVQKAIAYQADLVACGAADYAGDTYANMTGGTVCFYGLIGSWEVAEYNEYFGKLGQEWALMPWPTEKGGTDWQGLITSAGYVVSAECAAMEKGDVAKRIAVSFMSSRTQEKMVRDEKVSLPLRHTVADDYRSPENDSVYSPKTRGVFLDVISGEHGFSPAQYSTFDDVWLGELDTQLEIMWTQRASAKTYFDNPAAISGSYSWSALQQRMQDQYNATKND